MRPSDDVWMTVWLLKFHDVLPWKAGANGVEQIDQRRARLLERYKELTGNDYVER